MMVELLLFVMGVFAAFVLDTWWWMIDYRKAEKGLEFHEHYHAGLELLILALLTFKLASTPLAYIPAGLGFGLIIAEWRQAVEVAGRRVKPGHPFAYGSNHFTQSTLLGIVLTTILIALILLL